MISTNLPHDVATASWYIPETALSSVDILRDTYEVAREIFKSELTKDEYKRTWIDKQPSIDDVQATVSRAATSYLSKPSSSATKWVIALSSRITHFGAVLDVLVQHHPEYVSLAWGAFKFIFIAVLNHDTMIKEMSKAFCAIADVLPRADLALHLYRTERMKQIGARLYSKIIVFFQKALKWLKKGKAAHAIDAVLKPWALHFEDDVQSIERESLRLENHTVAAAQAELRDVHVEIRKSKEDLVEAHKQLRLITDLINAQTQQMTNAIITQRDLHHTLHLDLQNQKQMIQSIQLTQLLSAPFMDKFPTSGACLRYCQTLRRRNRNAQTTIVPDLSTLNQWASQPGSTCLVTESASNQAAKNFLLDIISVIRSSPHPILWALRFEHYWENSISTIDILRILVLQALQLNPAALDQGAHTITAINLREAVDEKDWLLLLARSLISVPRIYIVIDSQLLTHATEQNRLAATRLVELLSGCLTSTSVKIFVSTLALDKSYMSRNWKPEKWMLLKTDGASVRKTTMPTARARLRKAVKKRYI